MRAAPACEVTIQHTRSMPDATAPAPPPLAARRRAIVAGAGLTALAALGTLAWIARPPPGPRRLPGVSYPLIDGRRLGPADLAGRVVLVNFWATGCAVCVAEMPDLARLHADYRARGFELLAIAMPYDRPDHVLHFARTRALRFAVALDPLGEAVAAWGGVRATPASWLVAPDGRVVSHWLGAPDLRRLRGRIEALLPISG
jgi:thiol-disulfide isomerase/thioredoxin